jgi:hypothetical protein
MKDDITILEHGRFHPIQAGADDFQFATVCTFSCAV